jgi:hypothetical protein
MVNSMFDKTEQLVRLLVTDSVGSTEAERSCPSLRRLKTYYEFMTQEYLEHCAVLHVCQHKLCALDIYEGRDSCKEDWLRRDIRGREGRMIKGEERK